MVKFTLEEIRFFRDEGYVIKRKVMDEQLVAQTRERLWENPPPGIDRNEPRLQARGARLEQDLALHLEEPR